MFMTKLEQPHIKKGLKRIWIILMIVLCPFFAWKTIESYNSIETWKRLHQDWRQLANTMEVREEEAPVVHAGGLDKLHYRMKKREYRNEAIEAGHEIAYAEEDFIKFLLLLLAIPTLFPIFYFLIIYILKGFSKDSDFKSEVQVESKLGPEIINKKIEFIKVLLSFVALLFITAIGNIFLPEIVTALIFAFGGVSVIRMGAIVFKGGKAFW